MAPTLIYVVSAYYGLRIIINSQQNIKNLSYNPINNKINLNGTETPFDSLSSTFISAKGRNYFAIKKGSENESILDINDYSVQDLKFLQLLQNQNHFNKGDYQVTPELSLKGKLIDLSLNKSYKNDLDTITRLKILSNKESVDISTITPSELHKKLGLISDNEVEEHLNKIRSQASSGSLLETNLVQIENFFINLGLNKDEALEVTKRLRKQLNVSVLSDLNNLSKSELESVFNEALKNGQEKENLYKQVKAFFSSINS
jgi:hypothetical protein